MKPIPLFGSGIKSYSAIVSSQRRLNCFYDPRPDGEEAAAIIRGTPGWLSFISLPTLPVRGWWVANNLLYVVAGSVLYSVTKGGAATALGNLSVASLGYVSMVDNGVQLAIVDGVGGYIFNFNTSAFSTITDGSFPNGVTTIAFLDGRFIANKPLTKQHYISALYDGTVWTPTIYFSKENSPDFSVANDVFNGTIILWGANSMEFWQDVGAAPNPFARINGASQSWGLAAVWSRAQVNNTVIFLGQNPQGSVQVMMLNGYVPTRISTTDIENIINSFSTFSDGVALTYIVDGHPMYQLTFPTGGRSFLYDTSTNLWSEVQTGLALLAPHFARLGIVFNSENYVCDANTGAIYAMNENVYTDGGLPIKRQVVSQHINAGGNKFTIASVFLDMETGVGLQSGQGSNPTMVMRVSKDGGRTWGYERYASMGVVGQYRAPRVIYRRLGTARSFVFEFTMTDPVKFVIGYGAAKLAQLEGLVNG
jgi:hypothetical protein